MIIPIILCGGSGTRLWPLSRSQYPKQFINLFDDSTLFQDAIKRLPKELEDPLIICNEDYRFIVAEQLRQLHINNNGIILEPKRKNTAPAVTLAAINLIRKFHDPTLLVLPADHLIKNNNVFHKAIKIAKIWANEDKLITFGIKPTHAETGYGYIKAIIDKTSDCYHIESFKEKPKKSKAEEYYDSGEYFWNSGMFVFKASKYLDEIKKYSPKIFDACNKSLQVLNKDDDFIRLDEDAFSMCPSNSIDYAVMENTADAMVIPLDAGWSDIGSWSMLFNAHKKDTNNNIVEGDIIIEDVKDSYIYSSDKLISVIGLSNIIVVDTQDALLVLNKSYDQQIKNIVQKLNENKRSEADSHTKVFRPWGYYHSIESRVGYQVKKIVVNSKSKLSLQKHKFRSEHWVIISGKAQITCGKKVFELTENQSTYIPQGEVHRLENNDINPLVIIEIQTGLYLGEDDIIRLEDDYDRT
jgi:mannose-1-phosphate guanylyltransferase/mannose-6-phosphate isomerase